MRSEVLTVVKMSMLVFWFVGTHQHFGVTYFNPEDGGSIFLRNVGYLPTRPRGVTTQDTNIDTLKYVKKKRN
jgi:hypothetical protein